MDAEKIWSLLCQPSHVLQAIELVRLNPDLAAQLASRLRFDGDDLLDTVYPSTPVACALAEFTPVRVEGGRIRSMRVSVDDRLDRLQGLTHLDAGMARYGVTIDGCQDLVELRPAMKTVGMAPNLQRVAFTGPLEELARWAHVPELEYAFGVEVDTEQLWPLLARSYRALKLNRDAEEPVPARLPEVTESLALNGFRLRAEDIPPVLRLHVQGGAIHGASLQVADGCTHAWLVGGLPPEVRLPASVVSGSIRGAGLKRLVFEGRRPPNFTTTAAEVIEEG